MPSPYSLSSSTYDGSRTSFSATGAAQIIVGSAPSNPGTTLPSGVESYFNEDGNHNDLVSGHNGVGSGTFVEGKINSGYTGSASAQVPSMSSMQTISVWVKINSYGKQIWDIPPDKTLSILPDGRVQLTMRALRQGPREVITPFTVPLNQWNHFVVIFDGDGKLYVNGQMVAFKPQQGGGMEQFSWGDDGITIDEVGLWHEILSENKIKELYNGHRGNSYPFGANINVPQGCYDSMYPLRATCNGGEIVSNTVNNQGCRVITCTNGSISNATMEILACHKPVNGIDYQYFEIFRQTSPSNINRMCIEESCVTNELDNVYAKSKDFPYCFNSTNQTSTPSPTNTTNSTPPNVTTKTIAAGTPSNTAGFVSSVYSSTLNTPTAMTFAPNGMLFVSEKGGNVKVIPSGGGTPTTFVTLPVNTEGENGVMDIEFDPSFASNGGVYIYYTTFAGRDRLSRFTASGNTAVSGSEVVILDNIIIPNSIHNAGALHFGPDNKLYVTVGDGGVSSNAQDLSNLNGKILRINKDGSIPSDNPFAGTAGARGEIWAYGLRNPFTFAFDSSNGRMYINDVGEDNWEGINEGLRGANYGWPTCEGGCAVSGMTNPLYQYSASGGAALVGAAFNRQSTYPSSFNGAYFFADYIKNWIRYVAPNESVYYLQSGIPNPVDVSMGPDGNLYWLSISAGNVYKVGFNGNSTPSIPPTNTTNSTNTTTTTCYNKVNGLPANCTATITSDVKSGCRTIQCGTGSNTIKVQACDKTGFFEIYRQAATGIAPKICLANVCIQSEGYKKSPNYPICIGSSNTTTPHINTTTNTTSGDPGASSTLLLQSATLNGKSLNAANRVLNVTRGHSITGTASLSYTNSWPSTISTPLISTTTWGNHQSSFVWHANASGGSKSVSISQTAPTIPGTYYLIFAYRAELDAGDVASLTNWAYDFGEQWNDGNDIAGFTNSMINAANTNGRVAANVRFDSGLVSQTIPATAIQINVQNLADTSSSCYSSVKTIPTTCTGGTISSDTSSGNCRTLICGSGTNLIKVMACDKPDSGIKQYFEAYRQSSSGAVPKMCIGSTCIQSEGYKKSPNFPVCY